MFKKIFIMSIITSIVILSIAILPGCFGPSKTGKQIKIYVTGGNSAIMSEPHYFNIVVAAGTIEIGSMYMLTMPNNMTGPTYYGITAYYEVDGVRQDISVDITKDFSGPNENDCFNIVDINGSLGGGTDAHITSTHPGQCRMITSAEGITRDVLIFVWDTWGTLSNGVKITAESTSGSAIKAECAFYQNGSWGTALPKTQFMGRSYRVKGVNFYTYQNELYNIKNVDFERLSASAIETDAIISSIYIAEVPTGGYIKFVQIYSEKYWEWSADGTFR